MYNRNSKNKTIFIVMSMIICLGTSLGVIYYIYNMQDERVNRLDTALISISFQEGNGVINMQGTMPMIDEIGIENEGYEFQVTNTSAVPISAKMQLEIENDTTIDLGAIRYAAFVNNELMTIDRISDITDTTVDLYTYENFQEGATINCKLVFWVDYYYTKPNKVFSARVKVTGQSIDTIIDH